MDKEIRVTLTADQARTAIGVLERVLHECRAEYEANPDTYDFSRAEAEKCFLDLINVVLKLKGAF